MNETGHALFATAIGSCGIAWGPAGIRGVQLPEGDAAATRARLVRRVRDAGPQGSPPAPVADAMAAITALMAGEGGDLSDIALDMAGVPDFEAAVYGLARTIPPGATLTYGEVARGIGQPGAARAVGRALGRNPFAIIVPCHRVLAAGGGSGGFSARGGVDTKRRMLAIEGALARPLSPAPGQAAFDFGG